MEAKTVSLLQDQTVCVVDAYGLIYQVFHAPGMEMTNAFGEPTGAVFGFARDIVALMTKLRPDYLFCAYDMHAPTFRSALYPEYKANRPPTPDDLLLQFDFTREFLKCLGVPAIGVVGFEADDVMATIATRVQELGGKTILATSDKDARQLINDSTSIYLIRKDQTYGEAELFADWGIAPRQVVDFQALVGDKADNVPGVPLVGPKVASELLAKYDTLEGVFQGAIGQKGKRFENIRNGQNDALLSRQLVTLKKDAPIELDWNEGKLGPIHSDNLRVAFKYWNFRSLLNKVDALAEEFGDEPAPPSEWLAKIQEDRNAFLGRTTSEAAPSLLDVSGDAPARSESAALSRGSSSSFDPQAPLATRLRSSLYGSKSKSSDAPVPHDDFAVFELVGAQRFRNLASLPLPKNAASDVGKREIVVVQTRDALEKLAQTLAAASAFSVATITRELPEIGAVRPRFATLCGLAFAVATNEAFYVPLRAPLGEKTLEIDDALNILKAPLESSEIAKIGFNLKYSALVLFDHGVKLRGIGFDAALADYLARSGETRRELDELAAAYLDRTLFNIKGALGSGAKKTTIDFLPFEVAGEYAADSVLVPLATAYAFKEKIAAAPELERLAFDLEFPILEILAEMELNGIAINADVFRAASAEFLAQQTQLEAEIRREVALYDPEPGFAQSINLNSPKQLQRLLFEDLHLRVVKKTKSGPSVDAEVLEELATEHPIPHKIVEWRKLVKLRGTYLEPLPLQTAPSTRRICATFNQAATATGRLSSSDPNLQNIPTRTESGKLIRSGFVPDESLGFDAFVSCDYSQIELRVLAHLSGDERLIRAFETNQDVHASVASQLFHVAPENVDPNLRRMAKAVNFGLVYGQTAFGLSKKLNISAGEAQDYIDAFFATYPRVPAFFDRVLDECARVGYVQTALGRRRALSGVRGARGRKPLNFPERAAINAVVQGTAADIMKLAMIAVWTRLKNEGWVVSHWSQAAAAPTPRKKSTFAPAPSQSSSRSPASAVPQLLFDVFSEPTPEEEPQSREEVETNAEQNAGRERARLLLQIHDELLFETRREDADELAKIVVEETSLGNPLAVPLKIDVEIGSNWGEL